MKSKGLSKYHTFCFSLLVGFSQAVFSADSVAINSLSLDQHPAIKNPLWMNNAVEVRISKRGQRLFSEQLMSILSNLGVVIDENYFPSFEYVSKEPIKIDELAKKQPDEFKMLIEVREFFKGYLQGIEFNDFIPSVQIGDSGYKAEFNNLSLVTDEDLMRSLGKKDGAVLSIKMSVRNLEGRAEGSIKVKDLGNPWIGEIGVTAPEVKFGTPESPLIATMPFYVRVNEKGLLEFQALKLEENIDRVPIEVKYQNIVLPKFELKVEGQAQTYKISLKLISLLV